MPRKIVKRRPSPFKTSTTSRKTRTTSSARKQTKMSGAFARGSDGFERGKQKREAQEAEYQRQKNTPFTFRLNPGEDAEVVILDSEPPFFVSLHKIKNSRGRWEDEVCIADTGTTCPLCESTGKQGSYTMVLTVLDRRPYKIKNGPNAGKVIKNSKKLLHVKGRNLPKFERQYKGKAKGNFRGVKVQCHRDGDKESAMGEDLQFLGRVSEAALSKFGDNSVPADYTEIYPIPDATELRERHGVAKPQVAGQEEFEDDKDDADLDNVKW